MNAETNPGQEEEYHFGEPESTANYSAAATAVKAKSRTSGRNRFLFVIILATVIFALYKLIDILILSRGHTTKTTTTTVKTAPQPVRTPLVVAVPTTQPQAVISPAPVPVTAPVVVTGEVEDKLKNLDQQNTANQAAIDKLSSQMADIQSALGALNDRIAGLSEAVSTVNNRLEAHQAAMEARAQRRVVVRRVRVAPTPLFFVKTMIQGRAWLINGGGRIITVRVGDELPGYGTVRSIDPNQGVITLSSGAIIGYSPDDS